MDKDAPRSIDPLLFPHIFGAIPLCWYSITSLRFGGCFRAYDPVVYEGSPPLPTQGSLEIFRVCLGCFLLDSWHLAATVELIILIISAHRSELV